MSLAILFDRFRRKTGGNCSAPLAPPPPRGTATARCGARGLAECFCLAAVRGAMAGTSAWRTKTGLS
eukprot:Skav209115  [mRNA]  locus=scaffold179:302928:303128:+ [translate_table: standard]